MNISPYTRERIPDVLDFERRLREEESFLGDDMYNTYDTGDEIYDY